MLTEQNVLDYMDYLGNSRRVTETTLTNYRSTCERFLRFTQEQGGRPIEADSVKGFLQTYSHAASANTALVRLNGLATFLDVSLSKVPRAKVEQTEVSALDETEVKNLIEKASALDEGLGACVTFLYETGLRFSEFCAVSREHVRTSSKGRKYLLVYGKGRKHRKVPLSPRAQEALPKLPDRMRNPFGFEKKFRRLLKEAGRRARLKAHVHPHLLRASFISSMMNTKRVDSAIVAKIVGHSSVDTLVKHYYAESIDTLSDAIL